MGPTKVFEALTEELDKTLKGFSKEWPQVKDLREITDEKVRKMLKNLRERIFFAMFEFSKRALALKKEKLKKNQQIPDEFKGKFIAVNFWIMNSIRRMLGEPNDPRWYTGYNMAKDRK